MKRSFDVGSGSIRWRNVSAPFLAWGSSVLAASFGASFGTVR